jgi:capsular exopolysaccharide synthesis family protein
MSKNFELMQEVLREVERGTPSAPKSTTIVFPPSVVDSNKHRGPQEFNRVAQEECLKLVQRVFLGPSTNACRTIVFAGVDPGAGCSRICVETSRILAANVSGSVCLVDGDFRSPSLPTFLRVPNHNGLAEALITAASIRDFARQLTPSNLWLLSAGDLTPESPSLLNSESLKLRLQELRSEFDYVLIDAPALNLYSDAIALGRIADGVVVVLEADSTRRESALKGLQSLRDAHIQVLGAVLNRRTFPIPDFVYRRL